MGSNSSSGDEWIELRNITNNSISLSGWTIKARDGKPEIHLSKTIKGFGFFLLERGNDNSTPKKGRLNLYGRLKQ